MKNGLSLVWVEHLLRQYNIKHRIDYPPNTATHIILKKEALYDIYSKKQVASI